MIIIGIGADISFPVLKKRFKASQPPVLDTCSADDDGVGIEERRGDEGREDMFAGQAYLELPFYWTCDRRGMKD